jgi:Zn-dependent protease
MPGSSWWVTDALAHPSGPFFLTSWIVWVIGSIVLHELGHGWAAIHSGDRTPIERGHMTWNPLVHMGGLSLLVFAILGIAWGAMPVNPARLRGRNAEAKVAFAGPLMNLGLAATAILLGGFWFAFGGGHLVAYKASPKVYSDVLTFFMLGGGLNLILFAFNLLPIPPLDGSRILSVYVRGYREFIEGPHGMMIMVIGMIVAWRFIGPRLSSIAIAASNESIVWIGSTIGRVPVP